MRSLSESCAQEISSFFSLIIIKCSRRVPFGSFYRSIIAVSGMNSCERHVSKETT